MRRLLCVALLLLSSLSTVAQDTAGAAQDDAAASYPPIVLVTENYPPFNMLARNGQITGISTDIVRALMERNQIQNELSLLPWNRAYNQAQTEVNTGVYSTTRTEEREALFKWVSPLTENKWVFLAMSDSDIKISSLEEAKQYRIGAYRGDATALFLADQGFELDLVRRDELNARKLARGRIDLWATGHLLGPYLAKKEGVGALKEVLTFKRTVMGIAFHPDTPSSLIDLLNSSLKEMYRDGSIDQITAKYR
ncbi:transporter substrate-binding domain-containing protein [Neptunomonas sp. XY-337]|uniref:substrate-binding periplasmic protein n=1 Tax=Neptunomonas sp. XY-337 TaxID=2561897 RepID=UPI00145A0791|nr:transporter substrate-binding domain-containing protein [Neptunomonas sp. XY-337]